MEARVSKLQQSAPIWPFVRKFILLAHIASRASSNDVRYIVAAPTSQGDNMIWMPDKIFFDVSFPAIITFVFLPFYLLLKLFIGKRPFAVALKGTPPVPFAPIYLLTPVTLHIIPIHLLSMFRLSILLFPGMYLFRVLKPVIYVALSEFCSMQLAILSVILFALFSMRLVVPRLRLFDLVAARLVVLSAMIFSTNFAPGGKTAGSSFIFVEILSGSGIPFPTFCIGALLQRCIGWYTIVHGKASLLIITPLGYVQYPQGQHIILPPQYTIKPHPRPVEASL